MILRKSNWSKTNDTKTLGTIDVGIMSQGKVETNIIAAERDSSPFPDPETFYLFAEKFWQWQENLQKGFNTKLGQIHVKIMFVKEIWISCRFQRDRTDTHMGLLENWLSSSNINKFRISKRWGFCRRDLTGHSTGESVVK